MTMWTPRLVKDEMVRAFEVLLDPTGAVGPDWFKNNWPEYRVEFADEVGQHQEGTARTITRVRVQRTAKDITRMEMVLIGGKHPPAGSFRIGDPISTIFPPPAARWLPGVSGNSRAPY